ncbi:hypothetical protein [Ectothiorhodosinus mongolicus]|nr:hypothetical protein [Ectothiorhodosinus mongolicus]
MNAYMNLSTVLNRDGVDIATSGVQRESRATGDAMFDRIVAECREEAMQAHQAYLRSQDRERAQRESLVGSLAARIRGETGETENSPAEPEGDFIHTCVKPGPTYEQVSTETQQLADVLSGGRIWASILHNNTLGVILVRSPDSTEVAQVLQNQLAPARVLASAREEVRNRVAAELEQFGDDIPYGMVGTRMMRLSNSEWAIYAFGAAQVVSSGGSRFMDTITQDSQRQQSIARAQSELSRFSSLSISYSNQTQDVRSVRVMYRIEYNVTQDRFTSRVDEESTFGQLIDAVYTSSSTLTLRGSRTISTRLVKDENLDYYLSVVAWSPSIMAGQLADRSVQDAAGADAVRSGRYQTPGQSRSSQDGEASERSRVIILNQDW